MSLRRTGDDHIVDETIVISFVTLMKCRWVCRMDEEIVFHRAVIALTQFYRDSNTNIVVNVIVRRAVVKIYTQLMD